MTKKYICAVAGKSGGHIIPAVTLCQNFLKDNPDFNVLFFSTNSELDNKIISQHNFISEHIKLDLGKISKNPLKLITFIFTFIIGFFKSLKTLRKFKPTKVISTGGLVSIPVCLSAKLLKIPVEIYELNAIPGKATKFLSKLNFKIFTVFSNTCSSFSNKNCSLVNYPIRFTKNNIISKKLAIEKINNELNKALAGLKAGVSREITPKQNPPTLKLRRGSCRFHPRAKDSWFLATANKILYLGQFLYII